MKGEFSMRKVSFTAVQHVNYDNVPLPDYLKTPREIFEWIQDNLENFTKYVDNDMELLLDSGLYSAIIWDEDGNEIETITIDD